MFKQLIMSNMLLLVVVILIVTSHLVRGKENWQRDRRPKIMGDRLPLNLISPFKKKIQKNIVRYHNVFRTKVVPRAANMLRMKWHKGAALAAQKWAKKCMFLTHDNITGRFVNDYGTCGQNIFVASHSVPWLFAIKTWFSERKNFTYGSDKNQLKLVGHYTQLVWASTHEVGCGLSKCTRNNNIIGKLYYNYVCNYCPIGNRPGHVDRPYKEGRPCESCKGNCFARMLCLNSCNVADMWANCKELFEVWPNWLCNSSTHQGKERLKHCMATCTCHKKIHD